MHNSDRSYANRIRRLKGKIYASGTPYLSPTAKSAENMLVRIESQNPLRSLTPAGAVVDVSCCDGGDAPVTTYSTIVYSANAAATPTDDKCIQFTTLKSSGASDAYVVRYNDSGQAQWAARIGGSLNDNGLVVSSFGADSCAVAGIFTSPVLSFYNANRTTVGRTLINTGGRCIFLAVYDGTGRVQRVYRVSDIGPGVLSFGMTTSTAGDIYLTGYFSTSAITFTNASSVDVATITNSNTDIKGFLTKYPSNGSIAWAVPLEANSVGGSVTCEAVATDGASVYVTGSYNANATFQTTGSSPVQLTYSGSVGRINAFLVRYLDTGVPQWAARFGGTPTADIVSGAAIVAANDGVYVGGVFNNTIRVESADGSLFKTLTTSTGGTGLSLAKYNMAGVVQWATRITSSRALINGEPASNIAFMSVNGSNLYLAGYVADSTIICYNSDDNPADTSTPTNYRTGYLISYKTDGMFQFRRYMYGSDKIYNTFGYGVAALSGGVYTCGNYTASPMIIESNGSGSTATLTNHGGAGLTSDGHILKYNDTGDLVWRTRVGGADYQDATGIATCASGSGCFVVGNYGDGLA